MDVLSNLFLPLLHGIGNVTFLNAQLRNKTQYFELAQRSDSNNCHHSVGWAFDLCTLWLYRRPLFSKRRKVLIIFNVKRHFSIATAHYNVSR